MPPRSAVIIGAGPGGLIALRELRAAGIDAVVLEAADDIGGVYAPARVYADALLTTSSNMVSFGCHPAPQPESPVMWSADEYMLYLRGFVAAHGLAPHIHFSTRVTAVALRSGGGGDARVDVTAEPAGGGAAALRTVDHVVVCTGLNTHAPPLEDVLPGLAGFAGTALHSSQLRGPAQLAGKRVLVVGAGESGADIALMAARAAAAAALSTRAGPGYLIPRYAFGLPSDVDTCRGYHSLPRWLLRSPWHAAKLQLEALCLGPGDDRPVLAVAAEINAARGRGPFQRFGCKNTSIAEGVLRHGLLYRPGVAGFAGRDVTFTDGSVFADVDVVVACTGYRTRFPFLEAAHPQLAASLRDLRGSLFKCALHPDCGTRLTFCGFARPALGAIPPVAELTARYLAGLLAGELPLPPRHAMLAAIARDAAADRATFPDDAGRVGALTDYAPLMDSLAGLVGARPSLPRLLLGGHWALAWRVLFSSLSGAQFRLHGRGAMWAVAAPALSRYPSLPLPVALWELLAFLGCAALGGAGIGSCALLMHTA